MNFNCHISNLICQAVICSNWGVSTYSFLSSSITGALPPGRAGSAVHCSTLRAVRSAHVVKFSWQNGDGGKNLHAAQSTEQPVLCNSGCSSGCWYSLLCGCSVVGGIFRSWKLHLKKRGWEATWGIWVDESRSKHWGRTVVLAPVLHMNMSLARLCLFSWEANTVPVAGVPGLVTDMQIVLKAGRSFHRKAVF